MRTKSLAKHGRAPLSLCLILLLITLLFLPAGCGDPAKTSATSPGRPTTTTGSGTIPSSVPSATSIPSSTEPVVTPTVVIPTTQTPPGTTPSTPLQTTSYRPSTETAAPSTILERWPAASTIPALYTPNRANPGSGAPLAGMTVVLDAGHGGKDPGAVASDGMREAALNLPIAVKTRSLLEGMGATVVMTRSEDTYLSIYARIAKTGIHILNRSSGLSGFADSFDLARYLGDLNTIVSENTGDWDGAMTGRGLHLGFGVREEIRRLMDLERQFSDTVFVSIHSNSAAPDTSVRGLQVYYSPTEYVYGDEVYEITQDRDVYHWGYPVYKAYTYYDDAARAGLANHVFNSVAASIPELGGGGSAGVRAGNYGILRENNLASILVECGFMSNAEDLAILRDEANQNRIAEGIANGILAYFSSR